MRTAGSMYEVCRSKVAAFVLAACLLGIPSLSFASGSYGSSSTGQPTTASPTLFTSHPDSGVEGSGAFTQSIKIEVPPGRLGLQPDLSLEYNSQDTSDSIVGYGWNLSIPYIERLNKTGSERLYTDNYFTSSLGGELATTTVASSTVYRHKLEDGRFVTYTLSGNTWIAYDKKGTRYTFGGTDQSRQFATTSTSTIYKWMLEEVRDTKDNYVSYTYTKDGNEVYPSTITYTGHGSTDGPFTVEFTKSARPDPYIKYRGGIKVTTGYRITGIQTKVNGTHVRQYALSYSSGSNGVRSLLASVQRSGWDDSDTQLSEPATTFQYMASTTPFVTQYPSIKNVAHVVSDANGDGRNDLVVLYRDHQDELDHTYVNLNGGSGNFPSLAPLSWANYYPTTPEVYIPSESGTRFFDVNGDGRGDILYGYRTDIASTTVTRLFLSTYSTSTGYAWSEVASTSIQGELPVFAYTGPSAAYTVTTGLLGDINGDGIVDFSKAGAYGSEALLGNGLGWNATSTVFSPVSTLPNFNGQPMNNPQLIDINGDGLDDWVYSNDATTTSVRLNTGTGWESTPDSRWTIATSTLYNSPNTGVYWDRGMRFVDVNGDGLVDFIRSYSMPSYVCNMYGVACAPDIEVGVANMVYLNTGSGWSATSTFALPWTVTTGGTNSSGVWIGDIQYSEPANWLGNGEHDQDTLKQVNYPRGGNIQIEYAATPFQSGNTELPVALLTVTKVTTNDGSGGSGIVSYTYTGGKLYLGGGVREKRFAGFASTTETHADFVLTKYFSQGDGVSSGLGEQTDGYVQVGQVFREDVTAVGTSSPLQRTYHRWDTSSGTSTPIGTTFMYQSKELKESFGPSGSHRDSAVEYTYATTTGDLLQKKEYGEVTGNSDGTFSDIGSDMQTWNFTYAASSTINLSLPVQETLLNASSTVVTDHKRYYDGLSFGSVSLGNQTKQESLISGSTYASTTRAYNSYGLPTEERDARYKPTTYVYGPYTMYPATTTDALSHATSFYYDYATGKVKEKIDQNGFTWQSILDSFGRTKEEKIPDPSSGSLVTKATYVYSDNVYPNYQKATQYLNGATSTDSYTYFDGLGRVFQERIEATSTLFAIKDKVYSPAGLLYRESLPYFSSGASSTAATSTASLWATHLYDALQRPTAHGSAVGTTSIAYDGWNITETDPLLHQKSFYRDGFGNLIQVDEHDTGTYVTSYTYNPAKNLTNITDALGNVRNFTYDGLGRRLSAEDLHASGDGTYGTWNYTYDDTGNLTSYTDPKSQTVNRTYDDVGRPLTEDYTGGAGTEITYTYDSCSNGIGYLCTASSTASYVTQTYDTLGRVTSATTTIGGTAYNNAYTYDRQGNLLTQVNPNGAQAQYVYSAAGMLDTVSHKNPGDTSWASVVASSGYAPTGQITSRVFGNNATSTWSYNANQLYRLASITTISTSTIGTSASGIAASTTLSSNLVSYWPLDESSGVAHDATANHNDLTNNNIATYVSGKIGNATNFSSSVNQYLSIADNAQTGLDLGGSDFSISLWFNMSSWNTGDFQSLISKYDLHERSYRLGATKEGGSYYIFNVCDSTGESCSDSFVSQTFSTGNWYHVVVTFNASTKVATLYHNGTSIGTANTTYAGAVNDASNFNVGANAYFGNYANAKVDEVGIWNRVLSPAEVSALYASGSGLAYGNAAGVNLASQSLSYTYDAVGNITNIVDQSNTAAAHQSTYQYDNLNRLTSATIAAGSTSTIQRFQYDALGNITIPLSGGSGAGLSASSTLLNNLQAYWAFDESSGTAADSSGNNKTLTNDNSTSFVAGKIHNSADVVRSNSQGFTISNTGNYFDTAYGTVNLWMKLASNVPSINAYVLAADGTGSGTNGYEFDLVGTPVQNGLRMSFGAGTTAVSGGTSLSLSTWYMVTVTWSPSGKQIFVNAVSDGTSATAQTLNAGGSTYTVGKRNNGTEQFDGDIDEMAVWSRVLSPSEITALYNLGTGMGYAATAPSFTYASTNYANPHAVTTRFDGTATTTYSYDNNGNLTSAIVGATTTAYEYDYLNRLVASRITGDSATTTFGYDYTGQRVYQATASTTYLYPSKYFSIASSTSGNAATSTSYIYAGDTLVAYVEQPLINGTATGTPQTYYVHPDHLGSTNVITNASGTVVTAKDYYPYGSSRVNSGSATLARGYIGQFEDGNNISYLQNRYYQSDRGQFLSEDPVFWEIGQTPDGRAALSNPQSMNSYAYAGGNPITNKDPNGRFWWVGFYDWSGYEGMKGVGMKALEVMGGHSQAMSAMQANQGAVNSASAKYGVNPALANAVMYEEQSHLLNLPGIPFESTKDYLFPNSQLGGYDGGVGVMQVTGGVGQQYGYDKYELARDPRKNIDAGVGNLGKVQTGSTAMTASRYNNGSTQTVTNYGQRVAAQVNNPNYNTNVLVYGLQQIVAGLQSIISSLKK